MTKLDDDLRALSLDHFVSQLTGVLKTAASNEKKVYNYLKENYPEDTLDWVSDAEWVEKEVSLSAIKMARRPGGPREQDKVKGIAEAFKEGKPMEPVVLVDLPDGTIKIADGYHRTLGCAKSGNKKIKAWVGKVDVQKGKWDKEMHEKKLNVGTQKAASDFDTGLCKIAYEYEMDKAANMIGTIGNMAVKGVKGAGKEVKNFGKGITGMGVRNAKSELNNIQSLPNPQKSVVSAAKKNLRGERMNQAKSVGLVGLGAGGAALTHAVENKDEVSELAFGQHIPKQANNQSSLLNGFKNEVNGGSPLKVPEIKPLKTIKPPSAQATEGLDVPEPPKLPKPPKLFPGQTD